MVPAPSRSSKQAQNIGLITDFIKPFEEKDFSNHVTDENRTSTTSDFNAFDADASKLDAHGLLPYSPLPVPEQDARRPSYRDDVRRTIVKHGFVPSRSRYTAMSDVYALFISDNGYEGKEGLELEERFRSSLGRVLRPPSSADAFASSFSAPTVCRAHGYISMVSPHCPTVDLVSKIRDFKRTKGQRRRDKANTDEDIDRIREERRIRRLNQAPPEPEAPQHISFRYVDEFVTLNCARDLLKLKVRHPSSHFAAAPKTFFSTRV